MKNILMIRMPPSVNEISAETIVQWGNYTGAGIRQSDINVSTIEDLYQAWNEGQLLHDEELLPDQVILFLPGGVSLHKQVKMDASQRKHMSTALPYLIEEDIAQDIESMHLASYTYKKDDLVSLSVIPHEKMQYLLALFDRMRLPLDRVLTEAQFIEQNPDFTTIVLDTHGALISSPDHAGAYLDYDALKLTLTCYNSLSGEESVLTDLLNKENQSYRSQIKLYYSESEFSPSSDTVESLKQWLDEQGWLVNQSVFDGSFFEYLVERYFKNKRTGCLVDLRQGAYQCPRRAGRQIRRWKPMVAVLACWLVLELGLSSSQAILYQRQAEELWQQTMADYLKLFPQDQQAKNAVAKQQMSFNVKRVLENRLRSSDQKVSGKPFLPLLQKVSKISAQQSPDSGLEHQSMDFNGGTGQLVLEVKAGSLEAVDKFLSALKDAGLNTKLDSANQGKTSVLARMTIDR
ncbi:hypothetical protein ACH42_12780 [Endozoicomonas sp. (ex Bugula neritina AB1)]|nr:hypothetical protein ACH42_12780 [Endozoicomonas sp. (ex Bugula neritina AB1)]